MEQGDGALRKGTAMHPDTGGCSGLRAPLGFFEGLDRDDGRRPYSHPRKKESSKDRSKLSKHNIGLLF